MVCVRSLRTQQRVKNRCQLTSFWGGRDVSFLGMEWLLRFDYPLVDNDQTALLLVVQTQPGRQPFIGFSFIQVFGSGC